MNINLKKVVTLCCIVSIKLSAQAQFIDFNITVKMKKPMNGYKAFLYYNKAFGNNKTLDSAAFLNGKFEIKGKAQDKQKAFLYIEKENSGFKPSPTKAPLAVYLEKGNTLVSVNFFINDARICGTPLNNDLQEFLDIASSFNPRLDSLRKLSTAAYQRSDTTTESKLRVAFNSIDSEVRQAEENYFYNHPNSQVSLDWLRQTVNIPQNKSKAVSMFAKLGTAVKNSVAGKSYRDLLNSTASVEIGGLAPDFSATNLNGEEIRLSSYRGKYVLLDFWASWCAPCRKENPNMLQAYNKYQPQKFTVLSFSLDTRRKSWENAVEKDALPWQQLSDLKAMESMVVKLYGITRIPSNFLIDPQGRIIAKDLRGKALEDALHHVLPI